MTQFLGVPENHAPRHVAHELGRPGYLLFGLYAPRHGFLGDDVERRRVAGLGQPQMARRQPQQIFRIAADIQLVIRVNPGLADHQQTCADIVQIVENGLVRLAVQKLGAKLDAQIAGNGLGDLQMGLIDLGDPVVDQLLVQLFLLLEAEDLAGLLAKHAGDLVEGDVMVVRIVGCHGVDFRVGPRGQIERGHQGAVRKRRTVDTDDDGTVADGPFRITDDEGIYGRTADRPFRHGADQTSRHGAQAKRADGQHVVIAAPRCLHDLGVILALGTQPFEGHAGGIANFLADVVIAVGDDIQTTGDQIVMDLTLVAHLLFFEVTFRQPAFHHFEPAIVEHRRVGVNSGNHAIRALRQTDSFRERLVGVFRGVQRNQNACQRGRCRVRRTLFTQRVGRLRRDACAHWFSFLADGAAKLEPS